MLQELQISYGTGGNIFFGQYLGFLIATLFTGLLADRFGLKSVILLAGILLILGVGGYSSFHTTLLLACSLFVLGLGLGAMELGPNALIVNLHHARKGLYLNLMAVFHGLGSMLAPLAAGWLLNAGIYWRTIYRWELLVILVFLFYFLFLRFPKKDLQEQEAINLKEISKVALKGPMIWFYIAIALYVAAEIGVSSWLVTFLQKERASSIAASSQALSFFFGMIMLGRFIGGFIVHRMGYLRSILFASFASVVCIIIGLFGPTSLSFFLPLTGLFFSIIFPTITAAVSDSHTENINTILGMLFTSAGLGSLIGPWVIGWSSDLFGLRIGFSVNLIFAVLMMLSISFLMKGRQHDPTA